MIEKMEKEKIVEKIKKLLSLGGNNPDRAEAASALRRASELMEKYNIAESSVSVTQEGISTEDFICIPTEGNRRWVGILAYTCAKLFQCGSHWNDAVTIRFFGGKSDVIFAKTMFEYLLQSWGSICKADFKRSGESNKNSFAATHGMAFTQEIQKRCTEILAERTCRASQSNGIVEAKTAKLLEYMNKHNLHCRYTKVPHGSGSEYGKASGRAIPLGGAIQNRNIKQLKR